MRTPAPLLVYLPLHPSFTTRPPKMCFDHQFIITLQTDSIVNPRCFSFASSPATRMCMYYINEMSSALGSYPVSHRSLPHKKLLSPKDGPPPSIPMDNQHPRCQGVTQIWRAAKGQKKKRFSITDMSLSRTKHVATGWSPPSRSPHRRSDMTSPHLI